MVPTEAHDNAVNNIENLKKLQKTPENFDKIYDALDQIANENDLNAMNFAVNEKFHNVKRSSGSSIFCHSFREHNFQLIRLIEYGGSSIYDQCIPENSDVSRLILKTQHIDINATLIRASQKGDYKTVKLLLTVPGIDVNAKCRSTKMTALMWASEFSRYEIVELLLTVPGIDVNAKDKDNNTALIWASIFDRYEIVKLLLTVPGINVNAKNNKNKTALIWAGKDEIKEMLKTHGAV